MKNIKYKFILIFTISALLMIAKSHAQIEVSSDAYMNVKAGAYLITSHDLTINSGGIFNLYGCATINGTLTNSAGTGGLVVHSDATGTGSLIESSGVNATVERFITQDIYHYITPPVTGQNISLLQSGDPHTQFDLFWYDENYAEGLGPAWIDASAQSGEIEVGLGYTYAYNLSDRTLEFEGTTNTGNITEPVTYTYDAAYSTSEWYFGWNLVGNPYPSRINAETFIEDDDNSNIYGTLYFWDEGASYASGRNDYGTWNLTAATSGGGGQTPNGYIDVGQAFFVHYGSGTTPSSNSVTFKNSMRVHDEAVFFKNSDPWRFKISLTNEDGDYNETLIGFVPGTTKGFDNKYDGYKLKGNTDIALYTKLVQEDGYDYAIQALPPISNEGATVKLGFNSSKPGLHTLKVQSIENFNDTVAIYLEDSYLNIYTNLRFEPEYHFAVESSGTFDDRFVVHFNTYGVGIDEESSLENKFNIYSYDGSIYIDNLNQQGRYTAFVYNTIGQQLTAYQLQNNGQNKVSLKESTGIYIVKIVSEQEVCSAKVFVKR